MFQLGICQMHVTADKAENLRHAGELIRQAAAQGAKVVTLPEMFNCPYENACFPRYGEPAGGESWQFLSGIAKELGVYLIGGSVPELEGGKIYNTSYIFSPEGKELARHRKVHLFDIDVPGGQRFMESDTLTAGDSFTVIDTEYGKIGVAICFDIRFSDFFRVMGDMGAQLIVIPAAFNMTTGPIHWDLAFRMRPWTTSASSPAVLPPGIPRPPTWPTATPWCATPGGTSLPSWTKRKGSGWWTSTWTTWPSTGGRSPSWPEDGLTCTGRKS